MNARAVELIYRLDLEPHPEGGYFGRVFRSEISVDVPAIGVERKALTTIYYLVPKEEYDSWHRVTGDEAWCFYEGAPLDLFFIEPGSDEYAQVTLGPLKDESRPVAVVPGGCWQMARTTGEYTLVGCIVGPGFEYEDFQLLRDVPEEAREIQRRFPELAGYI